MCFANANILPAHFDVYLTFRDPTRNYAFSGSNAFMLNSSGLRTLAGCSSQPDCSTEIENCLLVDYLSSTAPPFTAEVVGSRGVLNAANNYNTIPNIADVGESVRFALLTGGPYGTFTQDLVVAPTSTWLLPELPAEGELRIPWLERRSGAPLPLAWQPVENSVVVADLIYESDTRLYRAKCYYEGRLGRGVVPAALFNRTRPGSNPWNVWLSLISTEHIIPTNAGQISVGVYTNFYQAAIRDVP